MLSVWRISWGTEHKVGLLGVHKESRSNKFRAQIRVNGKPVALGRFDTPELAHKAYLAAKIKFILVA